jgi:hypothetical protein
MAAWIEARNRSELDDKRGARSRHSARAASVSTAQQERYRDQTLDRSIMQVRIVASLDPVPLEDGEHETPGNRPDRSNLEHGGPIASVRAFVPRLRMNIITRSRFPAAWRRLISFRRDCSRRVVAAKASARRANC